MELQLGAVSQKKVRSELEAKQKKTHQVENELMSWHTALVSFKTSSSFTAIVLMTLDGRLCEKELNFLLEGLEDEQTDTLTARRVRCVGRVWAEIFFLLTPTCLETRSKSS